MKILLSIETKSRINLSHEMWAWKGKNLSFLNEYDFKYVCIIELIPIIDIGLFHLCP